MARAGCARVFEFRFLGMGYLRGFLRIHEHPFTGDEELLADVRGCDSTHQRSAAQSVAVIRSFALILRRSPRRLVAPPRPGALRLCIISRGY